MERLNQSQRRRSTSGTEAVKRPVEQRARQPCAISLDQTQSRYSWVGQLLSHRRCLGNLSPPGQLDVLQGRRLRQADAPQQIQSVATPEILGSPPSGPTEFLGLSSQPIMTLY